MGDSSREVLVAVVVCSLLTAVAVAPFGDGVGKLAWEVRSLRRALTDFREAIEVSARNDQNAETTLAISVKKTAEKSDTTKAQLPVFDPLEIQLGSRPRWRWQIGAILDEEGKRHGAEIGVQKGGFTKETLVNWRCMKTFTLVDVWAPQKNYGDVANVNQRDQDGLYNTMLDSLKAYKDRLVIRRNWSHDASEQVRDNSLDYVYVDARHDYEAVLEDMRDWWPKLRVGGILSGHDYTAATSAVKGFRVQRDGSHNYAAVKGAVIQFSREVNRPYHVIREVKKGRSNTAPYASWIMRKS